jgi:hypothetical protein
MGSRDPALKGAKTMTQGKRIGAAIVAAAAMLCLGVPARADAHGDRDDHAHAFRWGHAFRPYFGLGYGYGYGPYWGPYWANGWWGPWGWGGPYAWGPGYSPDRGPTLGYAMMEGFGAIEVHARPKQAQVWVDGNYVAEARDLDGTPTDLWLKKGEHEIQVYQEGYVTFHEKVNVRAGVRMKLDVRLQEGPSQPPTPQTAQSR